jgi:hypothetical protein
MMLYLFHQIHFHHGCQHFGINLPSIFAVRVKSQNLL